VPPEVTPPHLPGPEDAGDVSLEPERLAVRGGDREVNVTRTQFRILSMLLGQPGRAFTRAELVERGIGNYVTERTVDVHVKELRRKLGLHGQLIDTVRGVGYRWRKDRGG